MQFFIISPQEDLENFKLEVDVFSSDGVDQHINFDISSNYETYYSLDIRYLIPPYGGEVKFIKWQNGSGSLIEKTNFLNLELNKWYRFKIEKSVNGSIKVWFKEREASEYFLIFDLIDVVPLPAGKFGFSTWSGTYASIDMRYDNLKIDDFETSTSLILLPGHGGSWCWEGIVLNQECSEWNKTPFINVYDNFKSTMLSGGYTEGVDYFEYYYDWRKPLDELADDFGEFINTAIPSGKAKIVGHSMGGLVARSYMQKYGVDKVEKLATVGSPHEGVLKAYRAWEGGQVDDNRTWNSVAFEILLNIHKGFFQTTVDAVHNLVPSTKDLLPIFNFLKDENNNVISINTLSFSNDYLIDLKSNLTSSVKDLLSMVNGENQQTIEYYKTRTAGFLDQLLGRWKDGEPIENEMTDAGDGTVLNKSSSILGAEETLISSSHSGLIETDQGIREILKALDLGDIEPVISAYSPAVNPSTVFLIRSPARIRITASDGSQAGYGVDQTLVNSQYYEEDGLLIINDFLDGQYQMEVIGVGDGTYHLDVGQLLENGNLFETIMGETQTGQIDSYNFEFYSGTINDDFMIDETGMSFIQLAKIRLKHLEDYIKGNINNFRKRRLLYYLSTISKYIRRAELENNYFKKAKWIKYGVLAIFRLRFELRQIEPTARLHLKNELQQVENILTNAWIAFWNQSGRNLSQNRTENLFNTIQNLKNTYKTRLQLEAEQNGENFELGNLYELILNNESIIEGAINESNFSKAWAYVFANRLYLWELSRLLR